MPRNNRTRPARTGRVSDTTGQRASTPPRHRDGSSGPSNGDVRIVAGAWRGRKIGFPAIAGLRPTPDRVRETLFNWLQFEIAGRRCLDLFAGSGALGFEALSRGASETVFVERDAEAAAAIRGNLARLGAGERGRLEPTDAFEFLARPSVRFDIVFLDPPYAAGLLGRACIEIESRGWLQPGAWIYLEDAAGHGAPAVPAGWSLVRSKKAGDVGYHLARRGVSPPPAT